MDTPLVIPNQDGNLDEQAQHYMDAISDAARKMGQLVDDLLSFYRMGRHLPSFQKMAMEALVRDILREFEPDTDGRKIDWRIGNLPVVRGAVLFLSIYSQMDVPHPVP